MFTIYRKATVRCDALNCTETSSYQRDAKGTSFQSFIREAANHFRATGWQIAEDDICRACVAEAKLR